MKGKHIGKKIIASVLMLAMICSNISVYAENQTEQVETEAQENIESIAEEAPSDEDTATSASQEEEQEPEVTEEDSAAPEEDMTQEPSAPSEPSASEEIPAPDDATTEPEVPSEPVTPPSEEAPPEEQPSVEAPEEEGKPEEDNQQPDAPEAPTQPSETPDTTPEPEQPAAPEENTGTEGNTTPDTEAPEEPADTNTAPTEDTTPAEDTAPTENTTPAEDTVKEQEPEETEPEDEEEPIDFEGLMSLEELTALDDETVDATMWENETATYSMRRSRSAKNWSFDVYYVNQDDRYDVTKTANFNLKYQMEFHTSEDLEPGAVQIKIPSALFLDRGGNPVAPNDIAVPQGKPDDFTTNRNTPFNYHVDEDNYLVFFNYRTIPSGTNAAWQVLYKNLQLMNIKDETSWTLTPEITVGKDKEQTTPLTGKVDSSVSLTSVLKTPYQDTALNYTPGLYTASQVEQYIKGSLPEKYTDENGRLKTSEYRFVVWDVKVKGNATQPWNLFIKDEPTYQTEDGATIEGEVVGYRDNSDRSTSYKLAIKEPDVTDESKDPTASSIDQREESWGSRFYVVTAYPAEQVEEGDLVQNDLTIRLEPADNIDEDVTLSASTANWKYKNYDWTYSGNIIGIKKETDDTVYTGWLDAYEKAKIQGNDYGEMPFTTNGHVNGYAVTHKTEGEDIGQYIPDSYYNMTTADDVIYLHPTAGQTDGVMLDGDDYYFSSVTIEQADYGYDIWEDKMVDSELKDISAQDLPENFNPSVRIYAMCSNLPEGAPTPDKAGWVLIKEIKLDESGQMEPYELEEEDISWQPWRIKVEHNSIDYRSTCQIDVNVCLKATSPKMQQIIDSRPTTKDERKASVRIENLSGATAEAYGTGNKIYNTNEKDQYSNYVGLEDETRKIYDDHILTCDNAYRDVTWLSMTAASFKESKSSNDVDNNRGLVEYMLTAYDGYEIYDRSCLDYLSEGDQALISPGRNHVVFYDLLPYGMNFDASFPVTAGRITNLDSKGNYRRQPKSWDTTQVKVSVNSEEIISNYRGTGRTLIPFRITFEGADATSYTNQKWIEGWGVHFRAYYDWKDMDAINQKEINSNISAFMPDFSERSGGSNDEKPSLCGLKSEVYLDNGVIENQQLAEACADLIKDGGNIDDENKTDKEGKPFDTTYRNVLYANNVLMDDIAVASESKIEKLVRADADRLGTFSESTVVAQKDTYSYSLTIFAGSKEQTNIVVYDRLENAAEDRQEIENFEKNPWQGTFQKVDISALEKQGIDATVYYNAKQDARITENKEQPSTVLTEANGWLTEEAFIESVKSQVETAGEGHSWTEYVKAVAVDLGNFRLEPLHSVSFQIKMISPSSKPEGSGKYAYNNASFYAMPLIWTPDSWDPVENPDAAETVASNSVRVGLDQKQTLEIIKKVSGDVPSAREDESFTFQVYEDYLFHGETSKHPLAFTEYKLYKADENGEWLQQADQVYATDGNGYLHLKHNEKAVFQMADVSRIKVQETENVFWESKVNENTTGDDESAVKTLTFTNTFRPVLYVQKKLAGVPEGVSLNESDNIFTFKIETKDGKGTYTPVADAEFWYVDSARLDGSIPNKLRTGRTDAKGEFQLKPGEIIALFPGFTGTEYQLTETDSGESWLCTSPQSTGILRAEGSSKIFTNYYKWKNLEITKQITHQSQEDYDAQEDKLKTFTFRVVETLTNTDGSPMLGADGEAVTVKKPSEKGEVEATAGLTWVLLDAEGKETATKGTLDNKGSFSCALGFRTVRIKGLEADKTYLVTEVTEDIPKDPESQKPLYQAVNDIVEIKMPIFSGKKEAEFTNDYQRRSLSVSKTLVTEQEDAGEIQGGQEILSLLNNQEISDAESNIRDTEISGEMQSDKTRAVLGGSLSNGSSEEGQDDDIAGEMGDGSTGKPDVEFTFYLKINGKVKEDYLYTVTKQGVFVREGRTGADGSFTLSDGETAVFEAVGMLGDSFEVSEKQDDNYPQIYPADGASHTGTLAGEGAAVSFVNGAEGSLYLSKEYVAADESDEVDTQYVEDLKAAVGDSHIENLDSADFYIKGIHEDDKELLENSAVEFILEVTGEGGDTYIWPKKDASYLDKEAEVSVTYINQLTGNTYNVKWRAGQSIKMYPWYMIVIPEGETGIPEGATYTLKEAEDDQHRIISYSQRKENMFGRAVSQNNMRQNLQLSQSYPEDDQPIVGTVAEKPIATIYNEARHLKDMSQIRKYMTKSSSEVPTGAKLVWRLEQYVGGAYNGSWVPASGIPYVVWAIDGKNPGSIGLPQPVSDRIETTGEDGRIILYKTDNGYPAVSFTENQVYLNLYDEEVIAGLLNPGIGEGDFDMQSLRSIGGGRPQPSLQGPLLRLVEVTEESDAEWGLLAGYFNDDDWNYNSSYGFNASYESTGFVNSNKMEPVEVEKRMSVQSDQQFTMILKQVVSVGASIRNLIEAGPKDFGGYDDWVAAIRNCVTETQPRGNIPYTIHNADGSIAGKAVTGANGEIKLYAGQYATLNLPEESLWTVEEDLNVTPTYSLENLEENTGGSRMIKLDENLMLINLPASTKKFMVTYDANGGAGAPKAETITVDAKEGSYKYTISSIRPTRDKYEFLGWSLNPEETNENNLWAPGKSAIFREDLNFYAIWRPIAPKSSDLGRLKNFVEIRCIDGTHDKICVSTWSSEDHILFEIGNPEYSEGNWTCKMTLNGDEYAFYYGILLDGNITKHELAPGEAGTKTITLIWDASINKWTSGKANNTILATFNVVCQYYKVTYTDGAEGEAFSDESHGKLRAGDKTPAFTGTPEREGYKFMGWAPAFNPTVSGDEAKNGVITYTAAWQKVETQ
ncbi:MAG: hypothetical protein HFI12_06890 [Lachnospiraceae bacterium]|nr:hypothetical protein [Lachnospiraceae bacterium]